MVDRLEQIKILVQGFECRQDFRAAYPQHDNWLAYKRLKTQVYPEAFGKYKRNRKSHAIKHTEDEVKQLLSSGMSRTQIRNHHQGLYHKLRTSGRLNNIPKRTGGWVAKRDGSGYCTFYILHCFDSDEDFFKVGITSQSIQERFKDVERLPYDYDEVFQLVAEGAFVFSLEQWFKYNTQQHRYTPQIRFAGFSECFKCTAELLEDLIRQVEK